MAMPANAEPLQQELVITRVLNAPRELVFKVWTDPGHAAQWWGPRNYPAKSVQMDLRPGGKWRHCLESTEGGKDRKARGDPAP